MNRQEAIQELKEDRALYEPTKWVECIDRDTPDGRLITALDMAIETLDRKDKIMPLICLRCRKDIPLSFSAMEEVGYTHYSYCEDCLREGLKLLRRKDNGNKEG